MMAKYFFFVDTLFCSVEDSSGVDNIFPARDFHFACTFAENRRHEKIYKDIQKKVKGDEIYKQSNVLLILYNSFLFAWYDYKKIFESNTI